MAKRLYVGNLSWNSTEAGLKTHFEQCGSVVSAKIILDKTTGRSRGFAFVEMDNAEAAITALNDKDFDGRRLRVSEAIERPRN